MSIQTTILRNLLTNDDFTRKVVPFLKKEYFEGAHKVTFDMILSFVTKYNKLPTTETLKVQLSDASISDNMYADVGSLITELSTSEEKPDLDWLLEQTEKWFKDREIHLAIMK